MSLIPLTPEVAALARRLVWFEPAEDALADPVRFLAYAFARATFEDMKLLRRYVTEEDFISALDQAPPGIIDPRSWTYWNLMMGRSPPPPLPARRYPAA